MSDGWLILAALLVVLAIIGIGWLLGTSLSGALS